MDDGREKSPASERGFCLEAAGSAEALRGNPPGPRGDVELRKMQMANQLSALEAFRHRLEEYPA